MNVIRSRAPLLFLTHNASLVSPFSVSSITILQHPIALISQSRKKKAIPSTYNRAYRFLSGFHGVNSTHPLRSKRRLKNLHTLLPGWLCINVYRKGGQGMNNHEQPDRRRSLHGSHSDQISFLACNDVRDRLT